MPAGGVKRRPYEFGCGSELARDVFREIASKLAPTNAEWDIQWEFVCFVGHPVWASCLRSPCSFAPVS